LAGISILNNGIWTIIYKAFITDHKNYSDVDSARLTARLVIATAYAPLATCALALSIIYDTVSLTSRGGMGLVNANVLLLIYIWFTEENKLSFLNFKVILHLLDSLDTYNGSSNYNYICISVYVRLTIE
jgi:hypothetical protein